MYSVAGLACAAALQGDGRAAGRFRSAAEHAENRLARMLAAERVRYERILIPLQHDDAFRAGYEAARDIDLAEAVRELRTT